MAAFLLVLPDVLVDRLVTDLENTVLAKTTADLLRAQQLSQQQLDHVPVVLRDPTVPTRSRAASLGSFLRFAWSIRAIETRAVATELTRDRAAMPAQQVSHRGVRERRRLLSQSRQRIALLGGDLVISHSTIPSWRKISSVSQIAPSSSKPCCTYLLNSRAPTSDAAHVAPLRCCVAIALPFRVADHAPEAQFR